MKRIIVLGGLGLFGRAACEQLEALGHSPLVASRRKSADIQVDANDPDSIRRAISPGDLVLDAAGPFQTRSLALIETALEIGFDVVDINDNLNYAEKVLSLNDRIDQAGIRVLSSASSVSAISAAVVGKSGVDTPVRVTGFIAPASRHTANAGSAISLIQSVGQPVRAYRNGTLETLRGWSQSRRFPMPEPVGPIRGSLFESADSVYLPRIWTSLQDVDMYIDTNTIGVNTLLSLAVRSSLIHRILKTQIRLGTWISRLCGSTSGGLGYEIESEDGALEQMAILSGENGFIAAIAPAVLAIQRIVDGQFHPRGLVLPDEHVAPDALFEYLKSQRITVARIES